MTRKAFFICLIALVVAGLVSGPLHAEPIQTLRLYTLDCGQADFKNMGMFSDTGDYEGKPGALAVPCFLIVHPKGSLLWDTGLSDSLAQNESGVNDNGIHMTRRATLKDELHVIGVEPSDLTYLAFSHLHFDYTGNANLFGNSTWILNRTELAWATSTPTPDGVTPESFSAYKTAKRQIIDGDYDVFGDGTVRILRAPGHTPGHEVLEINLLKAGTVILSGDLYHLRENRKNRRVAAMNVSRADSLASIERIERIIALKKARLVIQHEPEDFKAMPHFPAWLE